MLEGREDSNMVLEDVSQMEVVENVDLFKIGHPEWGKHHEEDLRGKKLIISTTSMLVPFLDNLPKIDKLLEDGEFVDRDEIGLSK